MNSKPWYASTSLWAAALAILVAILQLALRIASADTVLAGFQSIDWPGWATMFAGLLGGLGLVVARILAGADPDSPTPLLTTRKRNESPLGSPVGALVCVLAASLLLAACAGLSQQTRDTVKPFVDLAPDACAAGSEACQIHVKAQELEPIPEAFALATCTALAAVCNVGADAAVQAVSPRRKWFPIGFANPDPCQAWEVQRCYDDAGEAACKAAATACRDKMKATGEEARRKPEPAAPEQAERWEFDEARVWYEEGDRWPPRMAFENDHGESCYGPLASHCYQPGDMED